MDKLKSLLTHQFWLLFGATLLIPLVGWWMASGSLKAETETKTAEIKKAVAAVPPAGRMTPNDAYVSGAKSIVSKKEEEVRAQAKRVWERQKDLMFWPPVMKEEMAEYEFEEEIKDEERFTFVREYANEVARIKKMLPAFDPRTETGLVDISNATLPFLQGDLTSLSSSEIWNAQMDNWFTAAIFEAIHDVNGDDEELSILEAPVRQIAVLMYKGGRPEGAEVPGLTDPTGSGDPSGIEGSGLESEGSNTSYSPFGSSGSVGGEFGAGFGVSRGSSSDGSSGTGTRIGRSAATFDPKMVFGDPAMTPTGSEAELTDSRPSLNSFGGRSRVAEERRYIEDGEGLPYRTRGFYLHVIVRNEAIPELLLALSSMEWPTSIEHVQVAELHESQVVRGDAGRFEEGGGGRFEGGGIGGGAVRRPPIRLGNPAGIEGGGRGEDTQQSGNLVAAALEDKHLAEVVIAGVITIYNEPKEDESATSDPSATLDPTGPETTDRPSETDGTAEAGETNEPADEPSSVEPDADPTDPEATGSEPAADGEKDGDSTSAKENTETKSTSAGTTEAAPASNEGEPGTPPAGP